MTQQNVELARRAYDTFNARDWEACRAASDTPIIDRIWMPARWRGAKCVWWRVCSREAEALEALEALRSADDPA